MDRESSIDSRIPDSKPHPPPGRFASLHRLVAGLLVLLVAAALYFFPEVRTVERQLLIRLSELGLFAPLALMCFYVTFAALLLPVFPLDLAAGACFGFWLGTLWVQVAATIGALITFLIGRYLFRGRLERWILQSALLRNTRDILEEGGWKVLFLSRVGPVLPYSLLNYAYGLSRVSTGTYLGASFCGMLPGTLLFVYAGDVAGDFSGAPGRPPFSELKFAMSIAGWVVLVAAALVIARRARREMQQQLASRRSTHPRSAQTRI